MASQKDPKNKNLGKFLSYILRHKPMAIGLEMDERGWVSVETHTKSQFHKKAWNQFRNFNCHCKKRQQAKVFL